MEIRHLNYFATLVEELNFNRAAKRLHISQPPLTRQIQQLEAELGACLFVRHPRGDESPILAAFLATVRRFRPQVPE